MNSQEPIQGHEGHHHERLLKHVPGVMMEMVKQLGEPIDEIEQAFLQKYEHAVVMNAMLGALTQCVGFSVARTIRMVERHEGRDFNIDQVKRATVEIANAITDTVTKMMPRYIKSGFIMKTGDGSAPEKPEGHDV